MYLCAFLYFLPSWTVFGIVFVLLGMATEMGEGLVATLFLGILIISGLGIVLGIAGLIGLFVIWRLNRDKPDINQE